MKHRDAVHYLLGLQSLGVKLGLANIRALLRALGSPDREYPCILVTGSNGKGSVVAMISSILRESGERVGVYTSPHLVRIEERIAVDGTPISPRRFSGLVETVRETIDSALADGRLRRHPTFFETITAMALLEFARKKVDVAVLEIGLGGRFDATNAVSPVVSVVTNIAREHTQYLGNSFTSIATEKAGIARRGRPLITGVTVGTAVGALRRAAAAKGANLVFAQDVAPVRAVKASRRGLEMILGDRQSGETRFRTSLVGRHQATNASVAIVAVESLPTELRPDRSAIFAGIAKATWPGRLEYVASRPRLLLDGAHNPHAAAALVAHLEEVEAKTKRVLLFSCLADKEVRGLLAPLARLASHVVLTEVDNPRAMPLKEMQRGLPGRASVTTAGSTRAALEQARKRAGATGLVIVAGSLYLIGEVKALLSR